MKNNIILLILFLGAVFSACEKEYIEPNNFSDVAWYTSQFRQTEFKIGVNDFISFSDLSVNEIEHQWTIEEGSFFLEGPIDRQDTNLEDFIINEGELTSSDKTIHVLFTEGGLKTVNLYNAFKDSVTYIGNEGFTFPSKKIGDRWVIDTTFVVDVYDTIMPAVRVQQFDEDIIFSSDTVYVEAGDVLKFIDETSIGRPDNRTWNVAGTTSKESEATITFTKLGVFGASLSLSRSEPNIPGDWEQWDMPNPIKVIPSSQPFTLFGDIVEAEDETILVPFNGEFEPFINQEEFFSVTVNGIDFPIETVSVYPVDATFIAIKLVNPIYRPDEITVSMAAGSIIESTDMRIPEIFTDVPVKMHDVNLLDQATYAFENGGDGWIPSWDNAGTLEFVTTDPDGQNNACMRLESPEVDWVKVESSPSTFQLEQGKTYIFQYKAWIDPSTTTDSWGMFLITGGDWHQFWEGTAGKPTGEWITITKEYEIIDPSASHIYIRFTGTGIVYYDDFYIVEKEERP